MTGIKTESVNTGKWRTQEYAKHAGGEYTYRTLKIIVPHMEKNNNGQISPNYNKTATNCLETKELIDLILKTNSTLCLNNKAAGAIIDVDFRKSLFGALKIIKEGMTSEEHENRLKSSSVDSYNKAIEAANKIKIENKEINCQKKLEQFVYKMEDKDEVSSF